MKNRKTALVFTPYFPPHGGGLERYALEMCKNLVATHGWRIVVVTSGIRRGNDIVEEVDGITVHRLSYQFKISNTPFSFDWFGKIKALIKAEDPEVLNVHMPVPGIADVAAFVAGAKPLVVTYHAGSMHKGRFRDDLFIWLYEHGPLQRLLGRADRIICSSDFIRFNLLKRYLYKSETITPGVDATFFAPETVNPGTTVHTPPTVFFAAALNHAQEFKGLRTLIAAMKMVHAKIPAARLVVAGDGDMKAEYESTAARLGIGDTVEFRGALDPQSLRDAYHRADIFALPSVNEALGMVLLEAMACGLPVIGTNTGGIPLIIDDGKNGALVPPRDPQALAAKIIALLNESATRAAMGAAARKRVTSEFRWDVRIARYDEALSRAADIKTKEITRIAVVAPYFYPKIGGLENYAYLLAKNLQASGRFEVCVITSHYDGKGYSQDVVDGMTIHRLPISFKLSNTPINFRWFGMIKKIFAAERPDIVHIHAPVPYLPDIAARAAGTRPVVLTYHAGSMRKGQWPADLIIGPYEAIFLPALFARANHIVAISQEFAKRRFPQFADKISFIPTGVDLRRFSKTPLPSDTKTITYVGRIEHSSSWKGIEPLLQSMALVLKKLPHATLELVGGGDAVEYYASRAKELGIAHAVRLPGPLLGDDLVAAYRRATVVVLPSTSDSEAFSIALIEAMASGRPIIGTRAGGTPQVIDENKNGLLVPPKNPEALAAAIEKVLGDPILAARLADEGARRAQGFSWDIRTKEYADIFDALT